MEHKPPLRSAEDAMKASRSQLLSHYHTSRDNIKRKPPPINSLSAFVDTIGTLFNWAYHYLKSRFGRRYHPKQYPINGNTGVYKIPGEEKTVRIGLAGDWGSYTQESEDVAQRMKDYDPHYTIHLHPRRCVTTSLQVQPAGTTGLSAPMPSPAIMRCTAMARASSSRCSI